MPRIEQGQKKSILGLLLEQYPGIAETMESVGGSLGRYGAQFLSREQSPEDVLDLVSPMIAVDPTLKQFGSRYVRKGLGKVLRGLPQKFLDYIDEFKVMPPSAMKGKAGLYYPKGWPRKPESLVPTERSAVHVWDPEEAIQDEDQLAVALHETGHAIRQYLNPQVMEKETVSQSEKLANALASTLKGESSGPLSPLFADYYPPSPSWYHYARKLLERSPGFEEFAKKFIK